MTLAKVSLFSALLRLSHCLFIPIALFKELEIVL